MSISVSHVAARQRSGRPFRQLLKATNLRLDSQGRKRNLKTIRHTAIMLRCMFNRHLSTAELSVLAATSMQSLEKYYLKHLKKATHVQQRMIEHAMKVEDDFRVAQAS